MQDCDSVRSPPLRATERGCFTVIAGVLYTRGRGDDPEKVEMTIAGWVFPRIATAPNWKRGGAAGAKGIMGVC